MIDPSDEQIAEFAKSMTADPHCDDIADDPLQPIPLRRFLNWARLPASCKYVQGLSEEQISKWIPKDLQEFVWRRETPKLFADYNGERIRVVMASRFGDVGISKSLQKEFGYFARVNVTELSNFSDEK